ncbi:MULTISPECIES: ribosome maturation factor RimP [Anaerococcus]|uniref:Ribosome maturation factor RimP n=1 Tax=Anaerococcus nagyae TaxID=1755241 RepID=A0A3E2TJ77_9FIRM|nr:MULTISPECIES: ribosome maturation factor RimP [Anaerococcus]MDU1828586.1 ribosome maturation factor RimP [Anaerococcus sp.]MDU1864655.1 ribosome maturation factor RimP [Anaerococcus sp.]MDU2353082.1 ribosome maturation factor RimP [Anaerococcus sp.]MDU2566180.1 ribosome maturation factor RimP [Anaerococcus sp.]MDU3211930.1 ribosome maturation factor RimP [Anaerococcus sp.]
MDLITTLRETFDDDIKNLGYELIDIELRTGKDGKVLTFYIYSEQGITIDDCERVSNFLDQKLDDLDLVKGQYYLEVSSPDLSRPLKTDRDLEISSNELLKVTLKNGEFFLGYIDEIKDDSLVFSLNEQEEIEVNREDIKQIKIEIVF